MVTQEVQYIVSSQPEERIGVVSLGITAGTYDDAVEWILKTARRRISRTVCFANVHMVVEAQRHNSIAHAVNGADWVAPDGVPLLWAMRTIGNKPQERVAGMDVTATLLERAALEGIPVFFYGSTASVLDDLQRHCLHKFPVLKIVGAVSPPFRPATVDEDEEIIARITESGAGLVFVALGCPKQELWMARMRGRIPAVLLGVGGAIPLLAGHQTRAPRWMRQMGIEWCYRMAQEPRRLFKRYAYTNSLYIYYLLRQIITPQST